jgi:Protein of unknown function (DUF3574)
MRILATVVLAVWLSLAGVMSAPTPTAPPSRPPATEDDSTPLSPISATLFTRTELFFGSIKADGSMVSEEAFLWFLQAEITPRFPTGLTLLTGLGQFLTAQGVLHREPSRLLILLYPVEEQRESSEKIEQIRAKYRQVFHQEAILRADRCCELVGF